MFGCCALLGMNIVFRGGQLFGSPRPLVTCSPVNMHSTSKEFSNKQVVFTICSKTKILCIKETHEMHTGQRAPCDVGGHERGSCVF